MKSLKLIVISFITFISLLPFDSKGACKRIATVKYQQEYGWSKKYTVEVNFLTGFELNQATGTNNYQTASVYAIIFWDQDEASVIKLSTITICGFEVDCDCIDNTLMDLQGYDQDDDKWNICLNTICI